MNLKSINNRINRLENHGRKATGKIKIVSSWNTWIVLRDGKQFDTLEEAITYAKGKYNFDTINIDQVRQVIDSLPMDDLREIERVFGSDDKDNEKDELTRQKYCKIIFTPSPELAAYQKQHPEVNFEMITVPLKELEDI